MEINRHAEVTWTGTLLEGSGTINYVSSGAFSRLPVTWASRTDEHNGRTSPEELIAAAHASCFSMQLSSLLAKNGTPAERLDVTSVVRFAKGDAGWSIARSTLTVKGSVPGVDAAKFAELAESAKAGCPVSRALAGNVELVVEPTLA
jgi:osmotically inducible protein OsmC